MTACDLPRGAVAVLSAVVRRFPPRCCHVRGPGPHHGPWGCQSTRERAGGEGGIRTHGGFPQRFSRPPHSATLPPLPDRERRHLRPPEATCLASHAASGRCLKQSTHRPWHGQASRAVTSQYRSPRVSRATGTRIGLPAGSELGSDPRFPKRHGDLRGGARALTWHGAMTGVTRLSAPWLPSWRETAVGARRGGVPGVASSAPPMRPWSGAATRAPARWRGRGRAGSARCPGRSTPRSRSTRG